MAVLPKKYSKRGPVSADDYIIYMGERIEFDAQIKDKRILELERSKTELEENPRSRSAKLRVVEKL